MASLPDLNQQHESDSSEETRCRDILAGYKHLDFPDLSATRFPAGITHTVTLPLHSSEWHQKETLQAATTGAVARVLGAYCGCSDVLLAVGADRNGCRPLRVSWDGSQKWEDVSLKLSSVLGGDQWPIVSVSCLQDVLGLSKDSHPFLALLRFSSHPNRSNEHEFPVVVYLDAGSSELVVTANDAAFHVSVVETFAAQVVELIGHALDNPSSSFASLPHLSPKLSSLYEKLSVEERKAVYDHVPPVKVATDHLALQAKSQPDALAVRWYPELSPDESPSTLHSDVLTYSEWHHKANQLGNWLLGKGLEKGDRVAVCMSRDTWFHVVFIAVLRAGGCYVPIDPDLPRERQSFIAEDSDARFVITSSNPLSDDLFGSRALDIGNPSEEVAILNETGQELNVVDLDDLAYLLYTSGTTGTPKGCLLTHEGLSEAIWALTEMCVAATPSDDFRAGYYLSIASVAFDVHIAEILVPLAVGIPILSAPRSLLLEDLPYYMVELRISHVGIVPSLIEATMRAAQADDRSKLRYLASGGEKMSDAILDKWANHPTIRLANFYGPSEVTIGCAGRFMNKATPRANVGRAFANVSAYVVDENLDIVLRGAPGELVVEGPLVGRGYHGRADLTEKVFLEFPEKGQGRWAYRTGDLVRMMPDSTLEILGRIDTQIKLRGVRIESEGISSIIRRAALPDKELDAVTVLAKHPDIGVEQLVSFIAWDGAVSIALRKTSTPSVVDPPKGLLDTLRLACDKGLASYMRPSHIVPLSWIPLNPNGKTDEKALVRLFQNVEMTALSRLMTRSASASDSGGAEEDAQPTATEVEVMDVVERHVRVAAKSMHLGTNLLQCGLDSMGAIRLATDLRKAFGKVISGADVLRAPTIRGIAKLLEQLTFISERSMEGSFIQRFSSEWYEEVARIYPNSQIEKVLPPFPLQEGVLVRSAEGNTMYVQHVLMRCKRETSTSRLRDAWNAVWAKQDILRTVFHFGRDLVQVVLQPSHGVFPWYQKTTPYKDADAFKAHFVSEDATRIASEINGDLSNTPPFRLSLYSGDEDAHFSVLSIHHSLFDGTSLPLLLSEVEQQYLQEAQVIGATSEAVLGCIADSLDVSKAQQYWNQQFAAFDWRKTPLRSPSSTKVVPLTLPFQTRLSALQDAVSSQQVTLQALLIFAYGYLLATRMYDEDDVVFGVIRSGRFLPVEGIENALCPTLSILPARVQFNGQHDILQTIQSGIAATAEFEHVPLGKIQNWVRSGQSLFETLFSVSIQNHSDSRLWEVIQSQNPEPDYILAVEIVLDPVEDRLTLQAAFTADDVPGHLVEKLLNDFEQVTLQLIDPQNREQLLSVVSGSRTATPESERTEESIAAGDVEKYTPVDEKLIHHLQIVVAEFLRIGTERFSEDASLVALGLDSIRSIGLSRVLRGHGYDISSINVLKHPSIRQIAVYLGQKDHFPKAQDVDDREDGLDYDRQCEKIKQALSAENLKLVQDDVVHIFPTTALQAGMLSQTVNSGGQRYVHTFPLRLKDTTDTIRLSEAWKKVVQMFSILRTSFHFISELGTWAQVVHTFDDFKWSDEAGAETPRDWFHKLTSSIGSEDGDGFKRPPVYSRLIRGPSGGTGCNLLLLVMHHALYDGLSVGKLLDSVQAFYHGYDIGVPTSFTDLLPQILSQERLGTSFWVQRLHHLRTKPLPNHRDAQEDPKAHVASQVIDIDNELVLSFCRRADVTPQCLGQLAYAKLLAKLTGSNEVVFGHVVSGRSLNGADHVIGPCLNTVPCRVQFDAGKSNHALLTSIHRANVDALSWQHASLRSIHRALGVTSLWDSLFVYQPIQPATIESEQLWDFDTSFEEDSHVQYALNLELHEYENGFTIKAACSTNAMTSEELQDILRQYEQLLRDIVAHPDQACCLNLPDSVQSSIPPELQIKQSSKAIQSDQFWDPQYDIFRDILSSITGVPPDHIKAETDLIALGIDSITAIQIVSKARRIGVRLLASDVIQSKTIGGLLRKVHTARDGSTPNKKAEPSAVTVPTEEASSIKSRMAMDSPGLDAAVQTITIASPGMKWLIGAWQRSEGSRFQHAFAYRLPIGVDRSRLQQAWTKLLEQHAILRSAFTCYGAPNEPRIVVFKPEAVGLRWTEEDLTGSTAAEIEVAKRMKQLVSSPPSMREPPTRAMLLHSPARDYLLLYLHHFQYDAWSLQILLDDLARLYRGQEPSSAYDLINWLHASSESEQGRSEQRRYWSDTFSTSFVPTYFPPLQRTLQAAGPTGQRIVVTELDALTDPSHLLDRARSTSVSIQAVFLASWAKVQTLYTSSDESTFGLWHGGRSGAFDRIEQLAVPCMNVLPVHVPGVSGSSTLQLAYRIQDDLRKRTAVVEQSDLVSVDGWVGGTGKPLCNVFVNVVKIAPEAEEGSRFFEAVDAPYFIPNIANRENSFTSKLKIAHLIQDDIMIDIIMLSSGNVAMSLEAAEHMMDAEQAKVVIAQWAALVKQCLL